MSERERDEYVYFHIIFLYVNKLKIQTKHAFLSGEQFNFKIKQQTTKKELPKYVHAVRVCKFIDEALLYVMSSREYVFIYFFVYRNTNMMYKLSLLNFIMLIKLKKFPHCDHEHKSARVVV